ncbi:hypothetical protein RND81_09G033800 [Saponaria officinalis]|uniref:DUF1995 domain-containing protein n=1 Tax=Saponaria officinalis TaxID=3572 RepID=A0AAW1IIA3_SAPOF
MSSNLLKTNIHSTKFSPPYISSKIPSYSFISISKKSPVTPFLHYRPLKTIKIQLFRVHSSISSSPTPPTSKEDAVLQAKLSLSAALQKPLNNLKLTGKIIKQKQPRFRVEIPVIDDSADSLGQLSFEIFRNIQVKKKGSTVKMLLIWPNDITLESGIKAFNKSPTYVEVQHVELNTVMTVDNRILNSADVAVFLAPNSSQLTAMKLVSENLFPRPLVLFNPKWAFEEEDGFGESRKFVGSFDVVYAFLGLEVRGLLSKRKGVVFKFVRDGVVSGEKWNVLVEDEEQGNRLKVVSRFETRPSITEVENVLYNLMAVNSPITKSAKFLRDLVSNVTGKKPS